MEQDTENVQKSYDMIDAFFFECDEMEAYLREAGFAIEEIIERDSYMEVEIPTQRVYIFARKP